MESGLHDDDHVPGGQTLDSALLAALSVGAIIYRADGRCETANDAAARILGYSTDQICRHELGSVGAYVDSTVVGKARETLVHGLPFDGRVAARTVTGVDLVLDVRLRRMQIAGEPALLVIFADVT